MNGRLYQLASWVGIFLLSGCGGDTSPKAMVDPNPQAAVSGTDRSVAQNSVAGAAESERPTGGISGPSLPDETAAEPAPPIAQGEPSQTAHGEQSRQAQPKEEPQIASARITPPFRQLASQPWVDLTGEGIDVSELSISPDGKLVVVEGQAWNLETGETWELPKVYGPIRILSDGKTFVSHTNEGVTLWSLVTWQPIRTVPGRNGAISPSGLVAVEDSSVDDHGFRVWNLATGEELFTFVGDDGRYWLSFSDDSKTLLLWSEDKVRLFDIATRKERPGIDGFPADISQALFSPDGTRLLCAEKYPSAPSIWDISDPEKRPRILARSPESVHVDGSSSFSPDGKLIVDYAQTASTNVLVILDAATMKEVTQLTGFLPPQFTSAGLIVAPTQAAQLLVADRQGRTVSLISVGKEEAGFDPDFHRAVVSPDGSILALPLDEETLRLVKIPITADTPSRPELLVELPPPAGLPEHHELFDDDDTEATLTFSADGTYLVGHGSSTIFAVYELPTGRPIAAGIEQGWCFLPDGQTLFCQSWKKNFVGRREVRLDLRTGREQIRDLDEEFRFTVLASSPDGKGIVAATPPTGGSRAAILYFPEGNPEEFVTLQEGTASRFAFSRDGRLLACWDSGRVQLFDLAERVERPTNAERAQQYLGIANNGAAIATAAMYDGRAALYDIETGTQIQEFDLRQGHAASPSAVAFSSASTLWATGDEDGTVLLRDWESGRAVARFHPHEGRVVALAFSWDGSLLATAAGGEADPVIRVWTLPAAE